MTFATPTIEKNSGGSVSKQPTSCVIISKLAYRTKKSSLPYVATTTGGLSPLATSLTGGRLLQGLLTQTIKSGWSTSNTQNECGRFLTCSYSLAASRKSSLPSF